MLRKILVMSGFNCVVMIAMDINEAFLVLDRLTALITSFNVTQKYIELSTLTSRYYVTLNDLFFPVLIENTESMIAKTVLEPTSSIYVHEQKIYIISKDRQWFQSLNETHWNKIRAIDLTYNEKLIALAATSIADKILHSPSEKAILKILPSNIRAYVEVAMNYMRNAISKKDMLLKFLSKDQYTYNKLIEAVLWLSRESSGEPWEIVYVRGVSIRNIKLEFNGYEISILSKVSSFPEGALYILTRLVPSPIITTIIRNIERCAVVSSIASQLLK